MEKRYHELWSDTNEIDFINRIGIDPVTSKPVLSNSEIIAILEGYIKGAKYKDWIRCGLSEGLCIKAAQDRIFTIKNNGGKG